MASASYTIDQLGAQWSAAQGASAVHLWRFAQNLLAFSKANPKVTLADIGAQCAAAVSRAKPYSKPWVSRFITAAEKVTSEPVTALDQTAFIDIVHGNESVAATGAKSQPIDADGAVKAAIAFANKAVKLGKSPSDIVTAIASAIGSAVSVASVKSTRKAA